MAGWRGTAIARAVRGEYTSDRRVFDIAEEAERRRVAALVVGGVTAFTLLLAGMEHAHLQALRV